MNNPGKYIDMKITEIFPVAGLLMNLSDLEAQARLKKTLNHFSCRKSWRIEANPKNSRPSTVRTILYSPQGAGLKI